MVKLISKTVGYKMTCYKCMSVFEFNDEDINRDKDRIPYCGMVYCPVCGVGNCVTDHGDLDIDKLTPVYSVGGDHD